MSNPDFADLPLCGDFDMRIARDGTWFYRGSPIARKPLVKLFSTVLRREDDGAYWLVTPAERGRVQVDDAPFTAVELTASGTGLQQVLTFRTNVDDVITVGAEHPIHVDYVTGKAEPSPYVTVRDGLDALILRPVFYHLVELGEVRRTEEGALFGVWSEGDFFPLGNLDRLETAR
ncbi:DUF1285 domain-containing protein [Dongia soli]|uniref:DUF1285 domain-containing protein n=1 Tax=Dongia soli TaxID=600628 RepID=A0ABU5EDK6_9PROT|nr:DUF1285 domain-containing protein [Dongia soli]MDY0883914.1 DUF1285 domain-containing protein [Dongia soli]